MQVKCDNCGYVHNVAGLYRRRPGTRKQDGGKIPAEGNADWGRYQCDGCDKQIMVPELSESEQGLST